MSPHITVRTRRQRSPAASQAGRAASSPAAASSAAAAAAADADTSRLWSFADLLAIDRRADLQREALRAGTIRATARVLQAKVRGMSQGGGSKDLLAVLCEAPPPGASAPAPASLDSATDSLTVAVDEAWVVRLAGVSMAGLLGSSCEPAEKKRRANALIQALVCERADYRLRWDAHARELVLLGREDGV